MTKKTTKFGTPRVWATTNRVAAGKGLLKGCWLVDPDGEKRATIMDETLARQIASAMNLTTLTQRTDYAAEAAGYKSSSQLLGRTGGAVPAPAAREKSDVYRALVAVQAGAVTRIYRHNGNTFKRGSGVSSVILRRVENMGFITDGVSHSSGIETCCPIILTRAGRELLSGAK